MNVGWQNQRKLWRKTAGRGEVPRAKWAVHLLTAGSSELGGDLAQRSAQSVFADRMPDGLRRPTRG